jgi:hypothetical protein
MSMSLGAFDHTVQAQAAQLIGHGAWREGLPIAAAKLGEVSAQIGVAKSHLATGGRGSACAIGGECGDRQSAIRKRVGRHARSGD